MSINTIEVPAVLTTEEAAKYLQTTRKTLLKYADTIPHRKMGGELRWSAEALAEYVRGVA